MTASQRTAALFRNRTFQIGVGLYALSLVLRLIVLMELRSLPTVVQCTGLDMRGNHEFALAILQGLRPTTFYKAPLYSYFLAGVYAIAGTDPFNARVVQVILTSLTPVLTFLIGQRLFGRPAGVIAGLVSSFFWTFLFFSVELLDTGLACMVYLLLVYLLLALDDRRWTAWLLRGLVLGVGAILRPNILPFAPVLAVLAFLVSWRQGRMCSKAVGECAGPSPGTAGRADSTPRHRPAWRGALLNVIALTFGCCAPILPVTLRNRIVGGEWVLLGAYGGMNIYVANNPWSDSKNGPLLTDESGFSEPTTWDPNEVWARCCLNYYTAYRIAETRLGRAPRPGEFADIVGRMGWDYLRQNPRWFASHAAKRLIWLFNTMEFPSNRNLYDFRQYSRVLTAASVLQFGVICPLGLLGFGLALTRKAYRTAGMAFLAGLFASLVFPAAMFHINYRFRVPIVHLLMPFAAFGLLEVIGLFRREAGWARRGVTVAVLAGLAVFSNGNWFDYWNTRGAHLQWAMVMACEKAGREDLLTKAVADFEQALATYGDTSYPSDTQLVLKHSRPMSWLFRYYAQRGNLPKALAYAGLLLRKEQADMPAVIEAFRLFLRVDDREDATRAIEVMIKAVGRRVGPEVPADCLYAFGCRYNDRAALLRAADLYEQASRLRPSEIRFHRAADEIRERLGRLTSTSPSQPSSPSRPVP
jgi:hypothetical protein